MKAITALGYTAKVVSLPPPEAGAAKRGSGKVLVVEETLPRDAPKFFREAIGKARAAGQPMVIDFWATWCGPCLRLKKETFEDSAVVELLKDVTFVAVDLDKFPQLGEAYSVASVPAVLLVDRRGRIIDRLQQFEPPEMFAKRIRGLLKRRKE